MNPYPRAQPNAVGAPGFIQNPTGLSPQSQGSPESATSRFKRAFGRRRTGRAAEPEDGTQSEAPSSKRLVPGGGISSLIVKKDPKPALQFATSTFQALGHRLNKQPVPRISSQIGPPPDFVVPNVQKLDEQRVKQPSPIPVAVSASPPTSRKSIHRTSQLVAGPEISAAIEYMLESPRNSSSTPASSPKPKPVQEQLLSPPSPLRRGSIGNDAAPQLRPPRDGVDSGKRRSMSLSFIPTFAANSSPPQVQAITVEKDMPPSSFNLSPKFLPSSFGPHSRSQSSVPGPLPTLVSSSSISEAKPSTESYVNGFIHPSNTDQVSSAANIRGKLSAWTSSSSHTPNADSGSRRREDTRSGRGSSPNHSKAASMVASIGPAATAATGMAMNLSKRAYEKVNSMWTPTASRTSHSNPHSVQGYDSSDPSSSRISHAHHPSRARMNHSGYGGSMSDVETTRRRMGMQMNTHGHGRMNEQPIGPNLGTMLRPPFRMFAQGGGLVFGRPLAECVRDTKPLVVVGGHEDGVEARFIPALVLRCVQHLERWGLSEEGLFRISGRTSHINKLRMEFSSGADYDLQGCGPGDLDPHAVASVLKAFLRELPDPILTRKRSPLFESAFERAKEDGFMFAMPPSTSPRDLSSPPAFVASHAGFGLPSSPRVGLPSGSRDGLSSMQPMQSPQDFLHLQPTPSTQQSQEHSSHPNDASYTNEPTVSPQEALSTLITEFHTLIGSLPRENRDLLLTIVELLKKAAGQSKTTKMPLSNLLLVLCPSMSMNPGVLKIFVEHADAIFMEKELPIPAPTPSPHEKPVTPTSYIPNVAEVPAEVMEPSAAQVSVLDAVGNGDPSKHTIPDTDSADAATEESNQAQLLTDPLPTEHLPVRKQSLRRLQAARTGPISGDGAPSAYTDVDTPRDDGTHDTSNDPPRVQDHADAPRYAAQLQENLQRQDGLHRSNSSSRSTSPAASYEGLRPAGPRPPRSIPAPLILHGRQGSTSSSQIHTPKQAEHPLTPPAASNNFSPRIAVFQAPSDSKEYEAFSSSDAQLEAPRTADSAPQSGEGVTILLTPSLPEVPNVDPLTSTFVDKRVTHLVQRQTIFASDITPPPSTGSSAANLSPPPATSTSVGIMATHSSSLGAPTPDTDRTMVSQPLTPLLVELERRNAGQGEEEGQLVEEGGPSYPTVEPLVLQKKATATSTDGVGNTTSVTAPVVETSSNAAQDDISTASTSANAPQQGLRLDKPPGIYSESSLSSASSAVTDSTNLFDREMSWPEVPATIPTLKSGGDGFRLALLPNASIASSGVADPSATDTGGSLRRPLPQPPQTDPATSDGQSPPQLLHLSELSPMDNDLITIKVSDDTSTPPLPATEPPDSVERTRTDSLSNMTLRQETSRAPRLTVNSKDMISGDSFWAKELQRVLRSASPTSSIEREGGHDPTRYSGEWIVNAAGT